MAKSRVRSRNGPAPGWRGYLRKSLSPLSVTAMEVPMSASTAAHNATSPNGASRTNTPFTSRETRTFCFMIPSAARESHTASASFGRSSRIRAMSAVSSATSVPAAPIAKPTEEAASAGASFTPSPTIPAEPNFSTSPRTASTFCSGSSRAL